MDPKVMAYFAAGIGVDGTGASVELRVPVAKPIPLAPPAGGEAGARLAAAGAAAGL